MTLSWKRCWGKGSSVQLAHRASVLSVCLHRPIMCYAVALHVPMGKDGYLYQPLFIIERELPAPR